MQHGSQRSANIPQTTDHNNIVYIIPIYNLMFQISQI